MKRETPIFPLVLGLVAAMSAFPTIAQKVSESKASEIRVLNGSATMHYQKDYLITMVQGIVGSEGIPEHIAMGDEIQVKDRTLKANHIYVTKCLKEMKWAGEVLCRAGQVTCVVVESPEDRPSQGDRSRLWVYVKECAPIR